MSDTERRTGKKSETVGKSGREEIKTKPPPARAANGSSDPACLQLKEKAANSIKQRTEKGGGRKKGRKKTSRLASTTLPLKKHGYFELLVQFL